MVMMLSLLAFWCHGSKVMFRSNLSHCISLDIPPKIKFLVGVTSDSQLSLAKKRINGY